jgi:hypothetical protein
VIQGLQFCCHHRHLVYGVFLHAHNLHKPQNLFPDFLASLFYKNSLR